MGLSASLREPPSSKNVDCVCEKESPQGNGPRAAWRRDTLLMMICSGGTIPVSQAGKQHRYSSVLLSFDVFVLPKKARTEVRFHSRRNTNKRSRPTEGARQRVLLPTNVALHGIEKHPIKKLMPILECFFFVLASSGMRGQIEMVI